MYWLETCLSSEPLVLLGGLLQLATQSILKVFVLLIDVFEVGIFFDFLNYIIFLFLILGFLQALRKVSQCIDWLGYGLREEEDDDDDDDKGDGETADDTCESKPFGVLYLCL